VATAYGAGTSAGATDGYNSGAAGPLNASYSTGSSPARDDRLHRRFANAEAEAADRAVTKRGKEVARRLRDAGKWGRRVELDVSGLHPLHRR
jgi:hypothetical protein